MQAQVEFSENVSGKSGCGFGYFFHKSEFAYGWSEANPDSEQTEPTWAKLKRWGSMSMEQIQDSNPTRRALNITFKILKQAKNEITKDKN